MRMQPKRPEECRDLSEIRAEIDRIDREVIRLIGERKRYVIAAAAFKTSEADVAAPERFARMLEDRRRWAEQEGLSPEIIENLYRELVSHFIAEEKAHWSRRSR
jgi:isochorismate pyruvate lyase